MPKFPLFVDLHGKPVLIVGGGKVALRKAEKLLPYGPRVTVVAPVVLGKLARLPGVQVRCRRFRRGDLLPRPALVLAATDDRERNRAVSRLCRDRGIPVNVADDPAACTFLFPALVRRGTFSAGITTGGASPTAAAFYKTELQNALPQDLGAMLKQLEGLRERVKETVPREQRNQVFHKMWDLCEQKGRPLDQNEVEQCLNTPAFSTGTVTLVGAGCGKADLITVRGLHALRRCQAVVYDDLIDPALLEAAPESARRIYVGKRAGKHAMAQEGINGLLTDLAAQGLTTVRLKGGDPFLFGRGGEEVLALRKAGVDCRVIPGIPSAFGIPAEYGIPVTHRGVSRGVHIATGHTAEGIPDLEPLAKLDGTLVFLMGLHRLEDLVQGLMRAGKDPETPAAVLSGGNAPHPADVRAPLRALPEKVREAGVQAPAILVVGDVTALPLS